MRISLAEPAYWGLIGTENSGSEYCLKRNSPFRQMGPTRKRFVRVGPVQDGETDTDKPVRHAEDAGYVLSAAIRSVVQAKSQWRQLWMPASRNC